MHLDEGERPVVWAHLMSASVLIMSRSSFSVLAGIANPKCVVYHDMWVRWSCRGG